MAYGTGETNNWRIDVDWIVADAEAFTELIGHIDSQHWAMKRTVAMGYYEISCQVTLKELAV